MVDYAEGHIELKRLVHDLYGALLAKKYSEAKTLCNEIVATARLTRAAIGETEERESVRLR